MADIPRTLSPNVSANPGYFKLKYLKVRHRIGSALLTLGDAGTSLGAASCGAGWVAGGGPWPLMATAFFAGGVTTPLYAVFLAYTNDFLAAEDMPAASGGLVFTFGLGAITGTLIAGWAMQVMNPFAFWLVLGATFSAIALYALYRMTQRAVVPVQETESYLGVLPSTSPVAVEAAGTWASEHAEAEREAEEQP